MIKVKQRKVLQFTGFLPIVGKAFAVFASSVLKVLPLLKVFIGRTFTIHQKSAKTTKLFFQVVFVVYDM